MKKLLTLVMVVLALALVFAGCSETGKLGLVDDTLVVAVDDTYPPMEYVLDGELVGFDIDFAKALAQEMGVEIEFKSTGWDGIFAGLTAKQYDVIISSVSITEDRKATMNFSNPYLSNGQVIVAGPALADSIKTPADLTGLIVGVQAETTADIAAEKQLEMTEFELRDFDDMTICLSAMEAGQIDCIVADYAVALEASMKNPDVFVITSALLTNEPIAVALNKDSAELLEAVNKAIKALQDNGTMAKISDDTFGEDYTSNIDTELR